MAALTATKRWFLIDAMGHHHHRVPFVENLPPSGVSILSSRCRKFVLSIIIPLIRGASSPNRFSSLAQLRVRSSKYLFPYVSVIHLANMCWVY